MLKYIISNGLDLERLLGRKPTTAKQYLAKIYGA
jgi:hypothetical protein